MFPSVSKGLLLCQSLVIAIVSLMTFWLLGAVWFGFWADINMLPTSFSAYSLLILMGVWITRNPDDNSFSQSCSLSVVAVSSVVSKYVFTLLFLMLLAHAVLPEHSVPTSFIVFYGAILYLVLFLIQRPLQAALFKGAKKYNRSLTLVVGDSESSSQVRDWLSDAGHMDLKCEYYDVLPIKNSAFSEADSEPFFEELSAKVRSGTYDQILLSRIPQSSILSRGFAQFCNQKGIRLFVVNSLHEEFAHSLHLVSYNGLQLIGLRDEPLSDPMNQIMKRLFDLAVAVPAFLLSTPLYILVALAHRFQAPGKLLFVQARSGLKNNSFNIFKFRSMYAKNEHAVKQAELNDTRVFPAGRLLRKFSLDEIPQFLNVIRGEMSIVGPRPHMVEHNHEFEKYLSNYNVRTFVKPGITGLAQVRGYRGETSTIDMIEKRVQSDVFYLENWTLTLDILIVLRTFVQVLRPPKSAY